MKTIHQSIAVLSAGLILTVAGYGQSIEFNIHPRVLNVGEPATAQLTVKGIDHPEPPEFPVVKDLQVRYRGAQQSTSMTYANGKLQSEKSVTYTFSLLPTKAGTYDIGPFTYTAGKVSAELPQIRLQVVAEQDVGGAGASSSDLADHVFVTMSMGRTNIFHQEICEVDFTVYFRGLNIGGELSVVNLPDTGLNMLTIEERGSGREERDGQIFEARRFRITFRALTEGTFKLQPTIRTQMIVRRKDARRNLFWDDPFFNRNLFTADRHPIELTPDPIQLTVKPLPREGRPPDFAGAVGDFSFDVKVSPTKLAEGDPITVTSTVKGQGSFDSVSAPHLAVDEAAFRLYEARMSDRDVNEHQTAGSKTFEQVVIPRSSEVLEMPAVTYSYFDPIKESYVTHQRGPFPLEVEARAEEEAPRMVQAVLPPLQPYPGPRQVEALNLDIAYLKPAPDRWIRSDQRPWYRSPLFYTALAAPWALVLLVFTGMRRKQELQRDVAKARRQQAPRSARAGIKAASTALRHHDTAGFHEALWKAFSEYFGHRLNLQPGDVTAHDVLHRLREASMDSALIDRLQAICEACDQVRFGRADAGDPSQLKQTFDDLADILRACERIRL